MPLDALLLINVILSALSVVLCIVIVYPPYPVRAGRAPLI